MINHADLAPFFAATPSALPGVFAVEGEELFYCQGGGRVRVLSGARPRALAVGSEGVLVSDGAKPFLFDPEAGDVEEIAGAPVVHRVAVHGDTYLMAGEKEVFHWRPGGDFVALPAPEHLSAVYGVSISPDGRYGVVAYDLDIPQGPRAGAIWAYDLEAGTILRWPAEQPKVMYGLWLLGWSDQHTVRFMTGQRGFNRGHTWVLSDGDPTQSDGTEYRMMESAWSNTAGSWFTYRRSVQEVVVQSAAPESQAIRVHNNPVGVDDPRVLLNGSLGFRTRSPGVWWEVTRDGQVVRWDGATELY
ncbi:MAG: hypothetical protein K0R39_2163 [Symbiobacteriaceae bacterium]|jgi:hypothetical protein|nr:hypothetical protein [Symbiobacteriaceae bacterium]